jgi:hypothetical protein
VAGTRHRAARAGGAVRPAHDAAARGVAQRARGTPPGRRGTATWRARCSAP